MLRILVVDDRPGNRLNIKELLEESMPEGVEFSVEAIAPLAELDEYAPYIRGQSIGALILDERLHEEANAQTGKMVSYYGHDVISHIRASFPEFPVYVVTTYKADEQLSAQAGDFEEVFDRSDFQKRIDTYARRIWRASARYQESMQNQLELMGNLSLKAAEGTLTKEEQSSLSATRELLGLPFIGSVPILFSDFISQAQGLASEAEALLNSIRNSEKKK